MKKPSYPYCGVTNIKACSNGKVKLDFPDAGIEKANNSHKRAPGP
jgi:hypothetical protein